MVNVVLDLLFVAVFHMAASGAALATVIAQAVSVAFSAAYLRRHPLPFALTRDCFAQKGTVSHILKVGAPIALQDFLVNLSFLIITSIVNTLGLAASAGIGVSEKLFSFLAIVPMAFMSALSAFVAQNMGAGQADRAKRGTLISVGLAIGWTVFSSVLVVLFCDPLSRIFSPNSTVIAVSAVYLKTVMPPYFLFSTLFVLNSAMRGAGDSVYPMVNVVASVILIRVPALYLLADHLGPEYMFWSYGIGWVITCALSVYHYAAGKWLGKYRAD